MAFSVSEFAAAGLPYGGARPSYFRVLLTTPAGIPNVTERMSFTCKAASAPPSNLSTVAVKYFGRDTKFAGTRTFAPWSVTILNDEDMPVRHALEVWSNAINSHEGNLRDRGLALPAQYRTVATVNQYSKVGDIIRSYEMVNLWPSEVGPMELNWENADQVQEFNVTFEYDFWKPGIPGTTGTFAV